jgi:hypothetical protein
MGMLLIPVEPLTILIGLAGLVCGLRTSLLCLGLCLCLCLSLSLLFSLSH